MQVVFHLGAHCTDENRILRALLRNRAALAATGVVVPAPGRYRTLIRESLVALRGAPATRQIQATLLDAATDEERTERLILSHDGFLCIPHRVISDQGFYGMAGRRVAALANLFAEAEVEFHIAMRNPATLVPALIGLIKGGSYRTVVGDTPPGELRWLPVIRAMREALPEARLIVWCNEDTPLLWPDILGAIADVDASGPFEEALDMAESLMTTDGLRRLKDYLAARPPSSPTARRRVHAAFLEKFARPDAMEVEVDLPGWTGEVIESVTADYDADCAEIAAMPGVEYLQP